MWIWAARFAIDEDSRAEYEAVPAELKTQFPASSSASSSTDAPKPIQADAPVVETPSAAASTDAQPPIEDSPPVVEMRKFSDKYGFWYKLNGSVSAENLGVPQRTWSKREKVAQSRAKVVRAYLWTEDKIKTLAPKTLQVRRGVYSNSQLRSFHLITQYNLIEISKVRRVETIIFVTTCGTLVHSVYDDIAINNPGNRVLFCRF